MLTHLLKVNTVLTAVGLGENKVGYTGAAAIAEAQLLNFDPNLLTSHFCRSDSDPDTDSNPHPTLTPT